MAAPNIAATQQGILRLQLPAGYKIMMHWWLFAKDNFGKELYKWTSEIKTKQSQLDGFVIANNNQTSITETDTVYNITEAK